MTPRDEIKTLADSIMRFHGGQAAFNLTEAQKIAGIGENSIHDFLSSAGVNVRKFGNKKMVSAVGIAEAICAKRVASYDNLSRGDKRGNMV
jgi:hypothetical protein